LVHCSSSCFFDPVVDHRPRHSFPTRRSSDLYKGATSVGGVLTTPPDASAFGSNEDVFARGTDNALWQAHFVNGTFSGWTSLGGVDRKSTRLNSSHGSISYAVFCLKQKSSTTQ